MTTYKHAGQRTKGFTLLELLIVIGIIAILSVILIIVINPAETLRKSRDAQRISDLNTLKTALGIYTTSTTTPYLGGATSNTACKTGAGAGSYSASTKVFYSISASTTLSGTPDGNAGGVGTQATAAALSNTDGTGWLPVNFDSLTSGSPISNLPVDPVNTVATVSAPASTDLVYRYVCGANNTYEIDATLESAEYTSGANNKIANDGGNNSSYYEVGTNLKLLGTGTNF